MSLNWREINLLLAEIPLKGSFIRQIHQPGHQTLYFELYNRSKNFRLFFSFSSRNCRLHLLTGKPANPSRPPRFVAFLRAHIRDGRVINACQIGRERIIKFKITKGEKHILLWIRLWGSAANMIATDEEGKILDAFYRRPKRQEVSGGSYNPEESPDAAGGEDAAKDRYTVRELPGAGSFNEKIERFYTLLEQEEERKKLLDKLTRQLSTSENKILANMEGLKKKLKAYTYFDQLKSSADLILSSMHTISPGDKWLVTEDFQDPDRQISIELDPGLTPAENAERFYGKYRKARSGLLKLEEEIRDQEKKLKGIREKKLKTFAEQDLRILKLQLPATKQRPRGSDREQPPGLVFHSSDFQILVGRTARENDALLRRFVKGNDTWLHCRDYPGAFVFIKSRPGKSIPLEVLLDAGNLALYYSKRKTSDQGDLYYTQVKYLRRIKKGKTGQVYASQEKNLFIKLDQKRIERLRGDF
ncbi:hypothetical protein ES703_22883 [subsurface metagenome]